MRVRIGVVLLALVLAVVVLAATGRGGRTPDGAPGTPSARPAGGQPCQTSDCQPGEIAAPRDPYVVERARIDHVQHWRVAPGITFRRWDRTDRRGQQRLFLLSVQPKEAGVSLQYGSMNLVPDRATVPSLVERAGGLGGVNGGFFDIHDTGAPLGVGVDRRRGFLHAAQLTWNHAFWMSPGGAAHISTLHLQASIAEYPQLHLTNYNSPRVRAGAIGVYTPRWGATSGLSVTDGQRSDIRTVVLRDDRVLSNRAGVTRDNPIDSTVLIGRGPGARQLAALPVGSSAHVSWALREAPALAISGETVLLKDGKVRARDDSILHPRTSVGIDRDTGRVLILVVDGRTDVSRGATLVEMAQLLKGLGAEDALNFDGGGSSTMVAPNRDGAVGVRNRPSDGSPRAVGDALVVRYRAP